MSGTTYAGLGAGYALLSAVTGLASLASGASATLGPFDNTVATLAGPAYEYADLVIDLGTATTFGTTAPVFVSAATLFAEDGTNYEDSFAVSGQLYPISNTRQQTYPSSGVSASIIVIPALPLRSTLGKVIVYNGSAVAFPAGSVASLYGYRGELA